MLISIVIPTFNRSQSILDCLRSCVAQNYRPLEIRIVDDGSVDDTRDVVEKFARRYSNDELQILYAWQRNLGAPAARNRGVCEAKGEFIQLLDSDDTISNNKIELQARFLIDNPQNDVAFCDWRLVSDGLIKKGPMVRANVHQTEEEMLRGYLSGAWFLPPHSYLFRTSSCRDYLRFDEQLSRRQDTDLLIGLLLSNLVFGHVKDCYVQYHRHSGDHIGHPDRFREHFGSLEYFFEKWVTALSSRGLLEGFRAELVSLAMACARDARAFGFEEGHVRILSLADELLGEALLVNVPTHGAVSKFRRSIVQLIRTSSGDSTIEWIKRVLTSR